MKLLVNHFLHLDSWIIVPYLILCFLGVIVVYSASSGIGNPTEFLIKQALYVIMGIACVLFFGYFKIDKLRNRWVIGILVGMFAIAFVTLRIIGKSINGSAGWFTIAGLISIQPSEFAKLFFVIYMANAVANRQKRYLDRSLLSNEKSQWWHDPWIKSMVAPILVAVILIFFILKQPDLGGAVINAVIVFVLFLVSGRFTWQWAVKACTGVAIIVGIVLSYVIPKALSGSSNYQLQRIVAVIHPFQHAQGIGKQLVNSYYALSNGGVFGVGLGNSIQKMGYLPEPNTDFIMAIVAEELGLVTVIIIILLLMMIVLRTVLVGIRDNNPYYALICYGVATYFTVEMFFNLGGVVGILPITGVTFPFISYGGSSMLTLSMGLGMVLNVARTQERRKFKITLKKVP